MPAPPAEPGAVSAAQALAALQVDRETGLSRGQAAERKLRFGANSLQVREPENWLRILARQCSSAVVFLLAGAMILSAGFGEWDQTIAIAIVLIINTAIGFVTERRAIRSMEALRQMTRETARVRRDGRIADIAAEDLVPGDIVLLDAGDRVPADLRVLESANLSADEAALTGESLPVSKQVKARPAGTRLHERDNLLFRGTAVVRGSGEGLVVGTGRRTELGHIAQLVESAEKSRSPLEERLEQLARTLVWLTLLVASVIAVAGILSGRPAAGMAHTAIALAVAAIPEGLPIVATLALARGMLRMARRNALIENLAAVETLGATTVILTDKTGTLTENRMTVERLVAADRVYRMDYVDACVRETTGAACDTPTRELSLALTIGALCSNAELDPETGEGHGDPVEIALLRAAALAGITRAKALVRQPEILEHAFDTATRMMATIHRDNDDAYFAAVKGAPESVMVHCTHFAGADGPKLLSDESRARFLHLTAQLAGEGYRTLALACGESPQQLQHPYDGLTLAGIAALRDPPRADVPAAIEACRSAGIHVVMVTGDHPATAAAIAESVSLIAPGTREASTGTINSHAGRATAIGGRSVFARVTPEEKLKLVSAFQDEGEVVAMTGDGVNDAPALKKADIGIAMGMRGTQVARQASDMVLRDDAFGTIVHAIREGRVIFENIRRFCIYLLSCNLGEILVIGAAVLSGLPLPLLPLQILFLNLVTDVFPAFALGAGEGRSDVLRHSPRPPDEPILGRRQWWTVAGFGTLMAISTLAAFVLGLRLYDDQAVAVSIAFLTLAFAQLWHVFNLRRADSGILINAITVNPYVWAALGLCVSLIGFACLVPPVADALRLVALDTKGWAIVALFSALPLVFGQAALIAASAIARRTGGHP